MHMSNGELNGWSRWSQALTSSGVMEMSDTYLAWKTCLTFACFLKLDMSALLYELLSSICSMTLKKTFLYSLHRLSLYLLLLLILIIVIIDYQAWTGCREQSHKHVGAGCGLYPLHAGPLVSERRVGRRVNRKCQSHDGSTPLGARWQPCSMATDVLPCFLGHVYWDLENILVLESCPLVSQLFSSPVPVPAPKVLAYLLHGSVVQTRSYQCAEYSSVDRP